MAGELLYLFLPGNVTNYDSLPLIILWDIVRDLKVVHDLRCDGPTSTNSQGQGVQ